MISPARQPSPNVQPQPLFVTNDMSKTHTSHISHIHACWKNIDNTNIRIYIFIRMASIYISDVTLHQIHSKPRYQANQRLWCHSIYVVKSCSCGLGGVEYFRTECPIEISVVTFHTPWLDGMTSQSLHPTSQINIPFRGCQLPSTFSSCYLIW